MSMVPSTSSWGGWIYVSVLPTPQPQEGSPLRRIMEWVPMMFEAGLEILLFLCLLRGFHALIRVFGLLEGGVSINDTYVVNTIRPLHFYPFSESKSLCWGDPPSATLLPLKGALWACPSLHERRPWCRFWVRLVHAWGWRPYLQVRRPHFTLNNWYVSTYYFY